MGIKPLRIPEKEPPHMTRIQVAQLYQECDDWLYTFVSIALNTCMRRGEILALKWENVDLPN